MALNSYTKLLDHWGDYNESASPDLDHLKRDVYLWNAKYCVYRDTDKEKLRRRAKFASGDLPLIKFTGGIGAFNGFGLVKHAIVKTENEKVEVNVVFIPLYSTSLNSPGTLTISSHKIPRGSELERGLESPKMKAVLNNELKVVYDAIVEMTFENYGLRGLRDITPVYVSYFGEQFASMGSDIIPNYEIFGTTSGITGGDIATVDVIMAGRLPQANAPRIHIPVWAHDNIRDLSESTAGLPDFKKSIRYTNLTDAILQLEGFTFGPLFPGITDDVPTPSQTTRAQLKPEGVSLDLGGDGNLYIKIRESSFIPVVGPIIEAPIPNTLEYLEHSQKLYLYGYSQGITTADLSGERAEIEQIKSPPFDYIILRYEKVNNLYPFEEPEEEEEEIELKQQIASLTRENERLKKEAVSLRTRLEESKQDNKRLATQTTGDQRTIDGLRDQIARLREELGRPVPGIPPTVDVERIDELRRGIESEKQELIRLNKELIDERKKSVDPSTDPTDKERSLVTAIKAALKRIEDFNHELARIRRRGGHVL